MARASKPDRTCPAWKSPLERGQIWSLTIKGFYALTRLTSYNGFSMPHGPPLQASRSPAPLLPTQPRVSPPRLHSPVQQVCRPIHLTATSRALSSRQGRGPRITLQRSTAPLPPPPAPGPSFPLDLEPLKDKAQAPGVSEWPLWPRPASARSGYEGQRWEGPAGAPGCRAPPLLLLRRLPRGQFPPAACLSLARLTRLSASRCPALLPVDLPVPFDAPGDFWRHITLHRVGLGSSLWPTSPSPAPPVSSLPALGACPHGSAFPSQTVPSSAQVTRPRRLFLGIP